MCKWVQNTCSCINVTHVTLRYVDEYEYKEMTPRETIESPLHFIFLSDTGKYLNYVTKSNLPLILTHSMVTLIPVHFSRRWWCLQTCIQRNSWTLNVDTLAINITILKFSRNFPTLITPFYQKQKKTLITPNFIFRAYPTTSPTFAHMIESLQIPSRCNAYVIFVSGIFGMNLKSYLEEHVVSAILFNSAPKGCSGWVSARPH